MEINLAGRIAVVTGATGELGRVMVLTLAKCGAEVRTRRLQMLWLSWLLTCPALSQEPTSR